MTIPGRGDLSPRRKRRNWRRRFLVLLVVVLLAGGGYAGYREFYGGSSGPAAILPACPSSTPSPPAAQSDPVVVRNATLTTGLATEVARALRKRGFTVGPVGNTLFRGKGVATVQYSADQAQAAQLLGTQFSGATLVQVTGSKVLEVDIGPKFRALVALSQAQKAERALARPTATPSVTSSATCAP